MTTEIESLVWDTEFFGYEIGKVTIKNPRVFNIEKLKAEAVGYRLIYIFSESELPHSSLKLVDKKIVFSQKIDSRAIPSSSQNRIQSFDKEIHNINELIALGLKSGVYSRFNGDPNFVNNEYERLYGEWVRNSVNGKLAFDILVSLKSQEIFGFTTISRKSKDLADIGLVAVDEKARGKGIGTSLIKMAILRAQQNNFKKIQVVTQLDNVPAVNLYQKTNFGIEKVTNIYHYWNL